MRRTQFPSPSLTRGVSISKHQSIGESERGEEERTGTPGADSVPHLLTHEDQAPRPETGPHARSIVFLCSFTEVLNPHLGVARVGLEYGDE